MKKSRFTEEQITYALRLAESGTPVADVCRQIGVSEASIYVWKKKYGKLGLTEIRELCQLRDENARLKRLVADLTLDKHILGEVIQKKALKPARRRVLAGWIKGRFQASTVRACALARFSRAAFYRRSLAKDQSVLRLRIRELAHARPRSGYQRIHVLLRREGWLVNKRRVRRPYRPEGLQLRMRVRRRKHMCLHRGPVPMPSAPHERWSMDFVHDQLFDGRPFLILTVIDQLSRESPMIVVDFSMSGQKVAEALDHCLMALPTPLSLTVDHGTVFTSKALEEWAWQHQVKLDFIRPGKPMENGHIESFNDRLRDGCLNVKQFLSLDDARVNIEAWRVDYNQRRPHSSLGHLTPSEFVQIRQGVQTVESAKL